MNNPTHNPIHMKPCHALKVSAAVMLVLLFSCTRPENEIFRLAPDNSIAVMCFNPANLMEKSGIQELDYLRKEIAGDQFLTELLDTPEVSGLKMNSNFGLCFFGNETRYSSLLMPVAKKSLLDAFIDRLCAKYEWPNEQEEHFGYRMLFLDKKLIVWNHSYAFVVAMVKNHEAEADLLTIAKGLVQMEKEQSLLAVKDFNQFLSKQKDMNLWLSSEALGELPLKIGSSALSDPLLNLSNNYGHVFAGFEKGNMSFTTNIRLNAGLKQTVDKYSFIDANAGKDILQMLPSTELFMVTNTYINPVKAAQLLNFSKPFSGLNRMLIPGYPELTVEKLFSMLKGDIGFSINGIKEVNRIGESDIYGKFESPSNAPVMHLAAKLADKEGTRMILDESTRQGISEKDGQIYSFSKEGSELYCCVSSDYLVLSNSVAYVREIADKGKVKANILESGIGEKLAIDPVCMYLNLDRDSYTRAFGEYIEERMSDKLPSKAESAAKGLKSLAFHGNMETWELSLEMKNTAENSLYLIMKSVNEEAED
jgi:hypothetical protein